MSSVSHVPGKQLAIEIDGGQHAEQGEADAARTADLERRGYRVLRFWNNDVIRNLAGVIGIIRRELDLGQR
jgi:very-short-patch-repair endonuclease